jgi:putative addiction module CopG family antidote
MDTSNFSVPAGLEEFVHARVVGGGYSSVGEYVGELIRADQKQSAWAALEAEILQNLDKEPSEPMTADDWREIREEVRRRFESRMTG